MNKKQKFTLLGVAAIVIAMLLFPPFYSVHKGGINNMGYRWLLHPDIELTVNVQMLLIQWGAVLIVGLILFSLFGDPKHFSTGNAEGSSGGTTIKSTRQRDVEATLKSSKKLIGVKGWLLFLCILLTILSPFFTLLYVYKIYSWSKIYSGIFSELQSAILSNSIFTIGLMGLGIYAGVMLWTIHKKALYIAEFYLWSILIYSSVSPFITPAIFELPDKERALFIDTGIYQAIIGGCAFLIWFTYLSRSKRVKNTFRKNYYYEYPPQKPSGRQTYSLRLKETVRTSSEILKRIRIGDFLYECKAKIRDTLPWKTLTVSILSLAILMAIIHYYLPWPGLDSIQSGEKRYPPPGGVSSGVTSPDTKVASVQKETVVEKPEATPPLPPQKPGEQGSPADSSAPAVSSGPPSATRSQVPFAVASKETETAKAVDTEQPEMVKKISKESAPPKKMAPPPKNDFYSIKIMAFRNPQTAQEFVGSQKKKGFDIHSRTITIQDQGLYHQIFLGHFGSKNEAQRFLEENKIRQLYPGSAIMKLTK